MHYNLFEECINLIKEANELDHTLTKVFKVEGTVHYSNHLTMIIIELLSEIFEDNKGWIHFYIYELDFGKNYYAGCQCCRDSEGNCLPLKSIHDLYILLTVHEKTP